MHLSEIGRWQHTKRIAAPMIGGMVSSTVLTLIIIPILFEIWRAWQLRRETRREAQ